MQSVITFNGTNHGSVGKSRSRKVVKLRCLVFITICGSRNSFFDCTEALQAPKSQNFKRLKLARFKLSNDKTTVLHDWLTYRARITLKKCKNCADVLYQVLFHL